MDFDLTDLRLFDAVLRAGSITAGAQAANLSLAAASTRLRDLELRHGVQLLERHRRGVRPTPAGVALQDHARRMLAEARHLQSALQQHSRKMAGELRLAVNTAALFHDLPEILAGFLREQPNFSVTLTELLSRKTAEALAWGEQDIAIMSDQADLSGLKTRPWREDRLVAALPANHPLADRASVDLAAIADEDFVGLAPESALQQHIEERAATGARRLRVRARMSNAQLLLRMVAAGAGIAIVPQVLMKDATAGLICVPLTDLWSRRTLHLAWSAEAVLPKAAEQLIEHLMQAADASQN